MNKFVEKMLEGFSFGGPYKQRSPWDWLKEYFPEYTFEPFATRKMIEGNKYLVFTDQTEYGNMVVLFKNKSGQLEIFNSKIKGQYSRPSSIQNTGTLMSEIIL